MKLITFLNIVLFLVFLDSALAQTTSFKCDYPTYSNENGNHKSKKFALQFVLDSEENKAYIIGNNGSAEVRIVMNLSDVITFMEITPIGNIMTTTILYNNGNSVHSRHTEIFGKIVPSQYYGKCKIQ